ncbi:hypothetical protein B9Z19DRAFT_1061917 [Tuber borchii]|uniref:Uncharacterized protein n=1 Tax=Tuber borchii TaxID=42251 RepID=A0A2T7A3J5_TUBBO|nr:hypothetical protein B9Z19DRAFT_1061917 [Tuber borchii]
MGSSEWCILLSASDLKASGHDTHREQDPISVEESVSTLRTRVCLGEAPGVVVHLRHVGDLQILEVISDIEFPPLIPSEKRSLIIKAHPGNPTALTVIDIEGEDLINDCSAVKQQINSIQVDFGIYETPLLTVTLKY